MSQFQVKLELQPLSKTTNRPDQRYNVPIELKAVLEVHIPSHSAYDAMSTKSNGVKMDISEMS